MRLVVADTGPINYLALIGHIDILPVLFEKVILPRAVLSELGNRKAPDCVREWVAKLPAWVEIGSDQHLFVDPSLDGLDAGEMATITLAISLQAGLLLMDDRVGVAAARFKGLNVTGTLGVVDLAAERGLVKFEEAIKKLERTSFRRPGALLAALLKKHSRESGPP